MLKPTTEGKLACETEVSRRTQEGETTRIIKCCMRHTRLETILNTVDTECLKINHIKTVLITQSQTPSRQQSQPDVGETHHFYAKFDKSERGEHWI